MRGGVRLGRGVRARALFTVPVMRHIEPHPCVKNKGGVSRFDRGIPRCDVFPQKVVKKSPFRLAQLLFCLQRNSHTCLIYEGFGGLRCHAQCERSQDT